MLIFSFERVGFPRLCEKASPLKAGEICRHSQRREGACFSGRWRGCSGEPYFSRHLFSTWHSPRHLFLSFCVNVLDIVGCILCIKEEI